MNAFKHQMMSVLDAGEFLSKDKVVRITILTLRGEIAHVSSTSVV